MNILVPRVIVVAVAVAFSAYLEVLALYSIDVPRDPSFIFAAMALFAVATAISLLPGGRMPVWVASFDVAVAVVITALVSSQLDLGREGGTGYATWHVAAVGTLMTIVSSRRRHLFAWGGIVFLVVHTIAWAGPSGIASLGVLGSISWVAVSHIISVALSNASRDAQRFAIAEREALDWQAAQDAHVYERQFRLGQTMAMALPMLKRIEKTGGDLSESERTECLHLEGAIRDEIRGRKLLNDAVREEVMLARRRGATVTLLDEGGLDELDEFELERVLARLALAIHETDADRVIARTVPEGSDVAVTVVGLRTAGDGESTALGRHDDEDEEVDLWLEIPRAPVTP